MRKRLTETVIVGVLAVSALAGCGRSTSPATEATLSSFTPHLTRTLTPSAAIARFGAPDREAGSGLRIFQYDLEGTDELWLGFPGEAPIVYARLQRANGTSVELPLP